ncbi:MAG: hypothetical protein H6659_05580 [Ardenticatenaceae bacterium]|nr:hypothetical protein [Ardenticatenaceae bacterium]
MTTIARRELKEKRPLEPITAKGRGGGFNNLLHKELSQWWGTSMWWIQLIIWVLILNVVSTIVMLTEALPPVELLQEVVFTFLPMAVGAVAIGTVITTQGIIVGEKQLGTAAWVMSKPASRSAFILAKALAYAIGFWTVALALPAIAFIVITRLLIPAPLALLPFLAGLGIAALSQLFYLMLTLMLGTLYNARGPVVGIGIALVMSGLLLKSFIPPVVAMVTPWYLPDISASVAVQMPLPENWFVPLLATGCWTVLFTAVALWRFSREEF